MLGVPRTRNKFGYGLTDFVVEDLDPEVLQDTIKKYNITYTNVW